jgi:transposase
MNYDELVKNQAGKLIEKLVLEIRNKKAVDVRFEFVDNDQWAIVSIYVDEQDNELALRLHPGDSYELYVGYYDDRDELLEITRTLTEEEKKGIPKGLQKVMVRYWLMKMAFACRALCCRREIKFVIKTV